jgi:subtilisin family serine protease
MKLVSKCNPKLYQRRNQMGLCVKKFGLGMMVLLFSISSLFGQNQLNHHSKRIIVKPIDGLTATSIDALRADYQLELLRKYRLLNAEVWIVPESGKIAETIAALENDSRIAYAEPDWKITLNITPNDPQFNQLWGMNNTGQSGGTADADIDAPEAWNTGTGGNVVIGVIDTGVDYDHQDLNANIWTNAGEIPGNNIDDDGNGYIDDVHGYDFVNNDGDPMDDHSHGTHCSGTIAAKGNNGIGVAGVCWTAKIMGLKFLDSGGYGNTSDAVSALEYAIENGAHLTSNSWGGGGYSQTMRDMLDIANAAGQLFVAAAGNDYGNNNDTNPTYPASYDASNVIAVASTDHNDNLSGFSNYGPTSVDLGAPGSNILSTVPGNQYDSYSGTSMATPHVAGAVGLMMALYPNMSHTLVKERLLMTVNETEAMNGIVLSNGRLNLQMAVAEPDDINPGLISDLTAVASGSNSISLTWTATGDDGDIGTASYYEIRQSASQIDESNWDAAEALSQQIFPQPAGSTEQFDVIGLDVETDYYFAIKAFDEWGNPSPVSNSSSATTLAQPIFAMDTDSLGANLLTGENVTLTFNISNLQTEASTLDFSFPAFAAAKRIVESPVQNSGNAHIPHTEIAKSVIDARMGNPVVLGAGGPDEYGYSWIDSNEPGGPQFLWTDISQSGTAISLGDDAFQLVTLPFSFPFYDDEKSEIRVSSNGYLTFSTSATDYSNDPIPSTATPNDIIAPFWDDLNPSGGGTIHYLSENQRFIVQYTNVPPYSYGGGSGDYTFQVILNAGGSILFQYLDMNGAVNSATVGIENGSGADGLETAFNTSYITDELAISYSLKPEWISNVEPSSGRILANGSSEISVTLDATGMMGGHYAEALQILSNDPDHSDVQLPIGIDVTGAADISITPVSLDFGNIYIGDTDEKLITVKNIGTDTLHISNIELDNLAFETETGSFSLAVGNSLDLTVAFSPDALGEYSGTLSISSNDADTPVWDITLSGNAVEPPVISVNPMQVDAALYTGDIENIPLTISNSGGSDLTWSLQIENQPSTKKSPQLPNYYLKGEIPKNAEYLTNEVIVKRKSGIKASQISDIKNTLGAQTKQTLKLIDAEVWTLSNFTTSEAVASYYNDSRLAYIEPNYILKTNAMPNDAEFQKLWGLHNTGQTGGANDADIDAPEAWDKSTGGPVIIGVIDTGVKWDHPDLAANMWVNEGEIPGNGIDDDGNGYVDDIYGYDFVNNDGNPMDDHDHGSHCSGTIAGVGNNGIGVAGVAWNAKIMALKFLSAAGSGSTADAILSLEYAIENGAHITSNSYGGGGYEQSFYEAIEAANEAGLLFVAAAGNDYGNNNDNSPHYPSNYSNENVISVASTTDADGMSNFSNYGPTTVDLGAPGSSIYSCLSSGGYGYMSGTSMATPHVAGAAALAMAYAPFASHLEVKEALLSSVDNTSAMNGKVLSNGRLNIAKTLNELLNWLIIEPVSGTVSAGSSQDINLQFNAENLFGGSYSANLKISSNDFTNSLISIPVTLNVTGAPNITLSADTLLFGENYVGYSQIRQVTIGNNGTDTLHISTIETDDNQFMVSDALFSLAPGNNKSITISYTAADAGTHSARLTISSNDLSDPEVSIALEASAIHPPVISANPETLNDTLLMGAQTSRSFWLKNSGGSNLEFSIPAFAAKTLLTNSTLEKNDAGNYWPDLTLEKGESDPRIGKVNVLGAGGPDGFGYTWIDSDQPGGPAYQWNDIRSIGTALTLADDGYQTVTLPFSFNFYGSDMNQLTISANGYLTFGGFGGTYTNSPIPTAQIPNALIAALWDDLSPQNGGSIHYAWLDASGKFIIQYTDVPHYNSSISGTNTFQIVLDLQGKITFYYHTLSANVNSVTAGIENVNGDDGLQIVFNAPFLHNEMAIQISSAPQWLDVQPWNGVIAADDSLEIVASMDASQLDGGNHIQNISIVNNDPANSDFTVQTFLNVIGVPDIFLSADLVDFGAIYTDKQLTKTLTLRNSGSADLEISQISIPDGPFTADTNALFLEAGVGYHLKVTFSSTASGNFTDTLTIISNDPDESIVKIALIGEVMPKPQITIDPTQLEKTLFVNESITDTLYIINSGEGNLDFSIPGYGEKGNNSQNDGHTFEYLNLNKNQPDPRKAPAMTQKSGGPDSYGYTWIDSDEDGGPTFHWEDISEIGTVLNLGDDASQEINLPFNFPFYGENFDKIKVVSNGFLAFGNLSSGHFNNQPIPTSENPNGLIAPFWDDLNPAAGGTIHILKNDSAKVVVQFTNVLTYGDNSAKTFQTILYPNGDIRYNYLTMEGSTDGATIGIESPDGTDGLEIAFNAEYVHDNLTVHFSNVPEWLSVKPAFGSVAQGDTALVLVEFSSLGMQPRHYEKVLQVLSNDPDQPECLMTAGFDVLAYLPAMAMSVDSVSHTMELGTTDSMNFTIYNHGMGELEIGFDIPTSVNYPLSVYPMNADIAPGDSALFMLHICSAMPNSQVGTHTDYLNIVSNDPEHADYLLPVIMIITEPVSVAGLAIPDHFALEQNYPNPFNPVTNIPYQLPEQALVKIAIYDIRGQLVQTLIDHEQPAGYYNLIWNGMDQHGRKLASGVYIYTFESPKFSQTRKLLLLK